MIVKSPLEKFALQVDKTLTTKKPLTTLLVARLDGLNPDHKAQLVAFIVSCDLPATGNGHIDACQHGSPPRVVDDGIGGLGRSAVAARRGHHHEGWSGTVEPSPHDRQFGLRLRTPIIAHPVPKNFLGQWLDVLFGSWLVRSPQPDHGFVDFGPELI